MWKLKELFNTNLNEVLCGGSKDPPLGFSKVMKMSIRDKTIEFNISVTVLELLIKNYAKKKSPVSTLERFCI